MINIIKNCIFNNPITLSDQSIEDKVFPMIDNLAPLWCINTIDLIL